MSAPAKAIAFPEVRKILLATDFSRCSAGALHCARAIAHCFGASIHIVHVDAPGAAQGEDVAHDSLNTRMGSFLSSHSLEGVSHKASLERGSVGDVLSALIYEENIDLVALGTHGHRRPHEPALGSVAQQVLDQARCPVLTGTELGEASQTPGGTLQRIVYATDFSPASLGALPYALSLARRHNSHLMLVHVDTTEVTFDWLEEAAFEQRLNHLVPRAIAEVCRIQPVIEIGPVAERIVAFAAENDANLIVLGGHRISPTSAAVVTGAHCPVLTVRGPRFR